ncbi:uncharacterized protein LOC123262499 [Cotesia glomerata]|uniref:uncharacterized protein LOC123262499 n=1 Tax=Cotesia glomerata TaxID=32391 RepID=UPI001D02299E|nr:uncharacterized protein LOC123262499 [Cotesia glomerata]
MSEQIGNRVYNYLIGFEIHNINNIKLPSCRDVLNLFMYKRQSLKLSIRTSASSVISDTNAIWANLLIPTSRPQHSIKNYDYMKLKNHRSRAKTSKRQRTNVEQFSKRLDKLFDIANCAALKNLPKNLQQFLTDCRKGNRNIHLPAIDVIPEETSGNLYAMEVETPNNEEIESSSEK